MWKSVFNQMWNRKRSNSWITVELLLVFCLTWYIVDYLFVLTFNYHIPNHRDVENTLQINLAEFDENYPAYNPEANEPEQLTANYTRILNTIRNYPGIESVGISFDGSTPGGGSYYGVGLRSVEDTTRVAGGQKITIDPNEDYLKVFRFTADEGKRNLSTKDFEWVPNGVILSRSAATILFPEGNAQGQILEGGGDSDQKYTVIGVIDDNKRHNYLRPQHYFYLSRKTDAGNLKRAEISVRYQTTASDTKFRKQFKEDMMNALQVGNFYLLSIIPYPKIEQDSNNNISNNVRQRISLMIFFLLCIFLCMMGTFWYRISLRPNEIGLRKAIGATRANIHYSLIIEGLWLLLIIVLPAMLIEYQFVRADLIETIGRRGKPDPAFLPDRPLIRFLITNTITFFVITFIIITAIWFPARKAASLAPADALHHE